MESNILSEEEMKKKMKADLFKFQLQAQNFDEKIDKAKKEKNDLEKENRKLIKENPDDEKIKKNVEKINKINDKLKKLNEDKLKSLGCTNETRFQDDTKFRPTLNII